MAIRFRVAKDKGANPPCCVVAAVYDVDRNHRFVGRISFDDLYRQAAFYGIESEEIEFI